MNCIQDRITRQQKDGTIGIIDTTLRDAQQCLWTTRMTTAMMLPIAEKIDQIGYDQIDFMAPVQFDVCVRYLKENPWEKARILRDKFVNTPLRGYCRSKSLIGFNLVPDDIVEMWIERLHANGFNIVGTLDALFDIENMSISIKHAKKIGMRAVGALVFCESPVHTDEVYAQAAKDLIEKAGADAIMIKDSGALLTPERIRSLVPALKAVMGDCPLELHTHSNTGLAPLVCLEGAKLGVDQIHTAIAPLASGPAQPAVQGTMRNLELTGFKTKLDRELIGQVSDYLHELAAREGFPLGAPMDYDVFHYKHQMPGGMLANWRFQLRQSGLEDRFDEILEEIVQIREDLGWPIMVTPFSQIIGVQAMMNVVCGERYASVADEIKMYALGHFGKLLAPVNPNVLDKIVANGSKKIPLKPEPLAPARPMLEKAYPNLSDDERLLRYMFGDSEVNELNSSGPIKLTLNKNKPVEELLKSLINRTSVKAFDVQRGEVRVSISR
jgi:oxaloacetate decarboxylase alpha subunit